MGRIVQQEDAKNEAHHVQLVKFEKKASRLPDDVTNLFSSIASKSERDRARVATTNEKRESEARWKSSGPRRSRGVFTDVVGPFDSQALSRRKEKQHGRPGFRGSETTRGASEEAR